MEHVAFTEYVFSFYKMVQRQLLLHNSFTIYILF